MLTHDLRYSLRLLKNSPAFLAGAVLALGLGIGANTTIFSFLNLYLLDPLPSVKQTAQVAVLYSQRRGFTAFTSYPDFQDWRQQSRTFRALMASQSIEPILTGQGEPDRIPGARVSAGLFPVVGARPALGRAFQSADETPGAAPVIIISHGMWQRRFGGRPDLIGQSLMLDGDAYKVIGIMPQGFRYSYEPFEFWVPLVPVAQAARSRRNLQVMARLKPGVPVAAAQAEMSTIARRLEMAYPDSNADFKVVVTPLLDYLTRGQKPPIYILMTVVAFVLLIACANIANLLLARATGRSREIAIRTAMGASRWRIIRQMLTESVVISIFGGLAGIALGYAGAKILLAVIPPAYHPLRTDFMDATVFAFSAALAIATGLVFGAAPAFQVSRTRIFEVLKEGGRSSSAGASRGRLRAVLVVAELSLAMILLLGAGLLIKGFARLQQVEPGFRAGNLLTSVIRLPDARYPKPEQRAAFFRNLVERAASLPGVESAAAASAIPLQGGSGTNIVIEGQAPPAPGQQFVARNTSITPRYLPVMGIALRRGRNFTPLDTAVALPVTIVNEALVRRYFPNQDPVGKRVKWAASAQSPAPWLTIVGVAGDVRPWNASQQPFPEMYAPLDQDPRPGMVLLIRTHADPATVVSTVRNELRNQDRDQPMASVRPMETIVEESVTVPKYMTILLAIFAAIALVMAGMGIYGVISYSVSQRTHELGVRLALGAGPHNVIALVLKQALWLIAIGAGLGLPAALATTRVLAAYLYGVSARDPITFTLVPLALSALALLASYIPARRATKVDPVIALRYE